MTVAGKNKERKEARNGVRVAWLCRGLEEEWGQVMSLGFQGLYAYSVKRKGVLGSVNCLGRVSEVRRKMLSIECENVEFLSHVTFCDYLGGCRECWR